MNATHTPSNAAPLSSAKIAAISSAILTEIANTGSIRTAYDRVMGAGAFRRLSDEVYDELRAVRS